MAGTAAMNTRATHDPRVAGVKRAQKASDRPAVTTKAAAPRRGWRSPRS